MGAMMPHAAQCLAKNEIMRGDDQCESDEYFPLMISAKLFKSICPGLRAFNDPRKPSEDEHAA